MKTFTLRETMEKGIVFSYKKDGPNDLFGIPIGDSIQNSLRLAGVEEAKAVLHWGDIGYDGEALRLIREQNPKDTRALVLVQTAAGVRGQLKLTANSVTEKYDDEKARRIIRVPNEFPPIGVEVLAEWPGEGDRAPSYLLSMIPGSSFRIERTGRLYGAPSQLVVVWNGRWDPMMALDPMKRANMQYWGMRVYGQRGGRGRKDPS